MNNLDKSWLLLILFGVIFFMSTVGWDIYRAISGDESEFSLAVVQINDNTLITEEFITHLEEGSDYRNYDPSPIINENEIEEEFFE